MSEVTAQAYGRFAEKHAILSSECWIREDKPFIDYFLGKLSPGSRLLDLGSGSGNQAAYFKQYGLDVVMSDATPEMLATARQNVPDTDHLLCQFPGSIPMADNSVDAVFCRHVLQHLSWDDFLNSVAEIGRVVRPTGIVALILPVSETETPIMVPWEFQGELVARYFYPISAVEQAALEGGLRPVTSLRHTQSDDLASVRSNYQMILQPTRSHLPQQRPHIGPAITSFVG